MGAHVTRTGPTAAGERERRASTPAVVAALAGRELRFALTRDRPLQILILVAPLLVVAIVGAFGASADLRVGVAPDTGTELCPAAEELGVRVDGQPHLEARRYGSAGAARAALTDRRVAAVLVAPCASGEPSLLVTPEERLSTTLRAEVAAAVAGGVPGAVPGDPAAGGRAGGVRVIDLDGAATRAVAGLGFAAPATALLLLFMTALGGGAQVMHARQLGLGDRFLAMPHRPGAIVAGFAAGRGLVAVAQAAVVMGSTHVAFGAEWGDPVAAGAVMVAFCAASAAAGLLLGTVSRTNAQATSAAAAVGLAAALVGGCVWPLEVFGPSARAIGHLSPHAWAMDGLLDAGRGAGPGDVVAPVAVLAGAALALATIAAVRLRRRMWSGS